VRYPGLLVALALVAAGCGGAASHALGCDVRSSTMATEPYECVDYENVPTGDVAGLAESCERTSAGKWLGGPCEHHDSVGGCRFAVAGAPVEVSEVQWWWPGAVGGMITDRASAKSVCERNAHSTYVEP